MIKNPPAVSRLFLSTSLLLMSLTAWAQNSVPLIPTGPPQGNACTAAELGDPNFTRFDPCCYPEGSPERADYCPVKVQNPFDALESFAESRFRNLLIALGLPQNLGRLPGDPSAWIAGQLADFVVDQARDFIFGGSGSGSGPLTMSIPEVILRLSGDEYLATAMFTSIASISADPNFRITENVSYKLPYAAGPSVRVACQRAGSEHKDRDFNRTVMKNGSVVNGQSKFVTQVGVPTEIQANRPSWSSRQVWDYWWTWWFGDGSMMPLSDEDNPHTVHAYNHLGNYTLAFVMLKDDPTLWIGASGDLAENLNFRWSVSVEDGPVRLPDACNYATMQVVPNNAPVAGITFGGTNVSRQFRFSANASSDPDGNPLAYFWRLQDGWTTRVPTFTKTYPSVDYIIRETVQLTVSDGAKMHTTTRTVLVPPVTICPGGTKCR